MKAVNDIYSFYVLHGLATFEEIPPSVEELTARRTSIVDMGLPYLVAEMSGKVTGYAYASPYRARSAYRYTVEDSVYVANGMRSQGIGAELLGVLIERCEAGTWKQMVAVIGNGGNAGSITLHERFGFEHVGTLKAVGFKLDQWVDTVLMQRALNGPIADPESATVPDANDRVEAS